LKNSINQAVVLAMQIDVAKMMQSSGVVLLLRHISDREQKIMLIQCSHPSRFLRTSMLATIQENADCFVCH
jgi:hypothetical protein